jgi:cysteine-S-conjugate beta-lyase
MAATFDDIERDQLATPRSRKWSLHADAIGAWVAEMDFGTAPEITAALHEAIDAAHLGYLSTATADRMACAAADWFRIEYGWPVDSSAVIPISDVMSAFALAVTHCSPAGSAVIVPTPAYMPFLTVPPALGREVIEVPGITGPGGRWTIDLAGIDAAFAAGAGTLVLCNPHNPTGRAFTRRELEAVAEIVARRGGRVFSDEIHAPLRFGVDHIPYASLSAASAAHTVTAASASKAWNLPGLKAAQLVVSDPADRSRLADAAFALHGASTPGVVASAVAYETGRRWLGGVLEYLRGSRDLFLRLVAEELPGVRVVAPEATYIAWLDCRELGLDVPPAQFFLEDAGVALTDGALCGRGYEGFARFVFALPRPILERAVRQMGTAVRARADAGRAHTA